MDAEHASIAEIRTALGGRCDWVTRRMLKRMGNPFPGRQQIAGWADDPPEWFPREQARRAARARRQQSEKVTIACLAAVSLSRCVPRRPCMRRSGTGCTAGAGPAATGRPRRHPAW